MAQHKGYRFAVYWIAANDDNGNLDVADVKSYISTLLVADLYGKEPYDVALDVIAKRAKLLGAPRGSRG